MQQNYQTTSHSRIETEERAQSPQVKIYNRNFYLRKTEHDLLQQKYYEQLKKVANAPKISVSSYHILSEKLQEKLYEAIANVVLRKQSIYHLIESKSCKERYREVIEKSSIDFVQLQKIIESLTGMTEEKGGVEMEHFQSQLWLVLVRYQLDGKTGVHSKVLYSVLRILLDPYSLNVKELETMLSELSQFQEAPIHRENFINEYPDVAEQTLTITQILKLWRKMRYSNPNFTQIHHPPKSHQSNNLTFKPQLNPKSKRLAEESLKKYLSTHNSLNHDNIEFYKQSHKTQHNELTRYIQNSTFNKELEQDDENKLSHYDILYRRKLKKDEISHVRIETEEDRYFTEKNSRVARPEEIKEIVNNLYVVKPKREDVDWPKVKEEEDLKNCTFSPKINKDYNYPSRYREGTSPAIRGYDKQISRMQKARQEKQRKRQAYENLGRVKNARACSKSPRHSQAPKFLARDAPKLILEINIDGNRVQKLPLKGDENPRLVSKKFVHMYGLQQEMIDVLQELVQEHLQNL